LRGHPPIEEGAAMLALDAEIAVFCSLAVALVIVVNASSRT
jgi:hypothetical protein